LFRSHHANESNRPDRITTKVRNRRKAHACSYLCRDSSDETWPSNRGEECRYSLLNSGFLVSFYLSLGLCDQFSATFHGDGAVWPISRCLHGRCPVLRLSSAEHENNNRQPDFIDAVTGARFLVTSLGWRWGGRRCRRHWGWGL